MSASTPESKDKITRRAFGALTVASAVACATLHADPVNQQGIEHLAEARYPGTEADFLKALFP